MGAWDRVPKVRDTHPAVFGSPERQTQQEPGIEGETAARPGDNSRCTLPTTKNVSTQFWHQDASSDRIRGYTYFAKSRRSPGLRVVRSSPLCHPFSIPGALGESASSFRLEAGPGSFACRGSDGQIAKVKESLTICPPPAILPARAARARAMPNVGLTAALL
jgi:hypothetical protein